MINEWEHKQETDLIIGHIQNIIDATDDDPYWIQICDIHKEDDNSLHVIGMFKDFKIKHRLINKRFLWHKNQDWAL